MDSACFREWARLKTEKSLEFVEDAMIGATARVHGLEVATSNEAAEGGRTEHSRMSRHRSLEVIVKVLAPSGIRP